MVSSRKSLGLAFLAVSQVVTIYLLVNVAQRHEPIKINTDNSNSGHVIPECKLPQHLDYGSKIALDQMPAQAGPSRKFQSSGLYIEPDSSPTSCVKRTIVPGRCSNEARRVQQPQGSALDTCAFDLDESDIVFGVWHSLATEGRLQPLLETWGTRVQIVLLASTVGVQHSKLFQAGVPGSRPHLLDTGVEQDDYFSTLGKAFVGLRLMLEAYPTKKWFVILGDDNYVLVDNYVDALSAFDPDLPWALSRMVFREKFGCKVAGGASVITSRALTKELAPHLDPWYQNIVVRSGGDVTKAQEEDKFHDIAFQRLVEHINHEWIHLDELPHEPPGFYFDPRLGKPTGSGIAERAALFHYVPGQYMHYLHFVSSQACTCELTPAHQTAALSNIAVGVYSTKRRLSTLDERRIANGWGPALTGRRVMLQASGRAYAGVKGDMARLRELMKAFPGAGWLLFLPVDHYVIPANLAVRIKRLEEKAAKGSSQGSRHMMVSGVYHQPDAMDERRRGGKNTCDKFSSGEEGALLVGRDLAENILSYEESVAGGVFPTRHRGPADREIAAWPRTLSSHTVLEDAGLVWRLPTPRLGGEVGCPATFPMEPDLADLKSEFTMSEGQAVMAVTQFLLRMAPEKVCRVKMELVG